MTITPGSDGVPGVGATIAGSLTVSENGTPSTLYEDQMMIAGPLTEATVTITSDGTPVPRALLRSLTAAVAKRVAKG